MATATSFTAKDPDDTTDPADPARYGLLNPPVRITGSLTIPAADDSLLGEPVTAMVEGVARREYLSGSPAPSGSSTLADDIKQPQRLFQLRGARLKDVVGGGMQTMFSSTVPRLADPAKAFNGGDLNIPSTTQGGLIFITGSTRAFRGPDYLVSHPTPDPSDDNDIISYAECGHFDDWFPTAEEKTQMDALCGAAGPFASGSPFDLHKVDELADLVSKYSVSVSPDEDLHQAYTGDAPNTSSAFTVQSWRHGELTDEEAYLNEDESSYPALGTGWIRKRWGRKFPGHENFKAKLSKDGSDAQFEILSGSAATEHAFDVFNSENGDLMQKNYIMAVTFRHIKDRVKWFDSESDGIPTFSLAQPCWAVARLAWRLERSRYDQIWYEEAQNNFPRFMTLYDIDATPPLKMNISGTLFDQPWDQTIGKGELVGTGGYNHIEGGNWYWSTIEGGTSAIKKYSYEYGGPESDGYIKTREWLKGVRSGADDLSEFQLRRKIQTGEGPDDVEWSSDLTYDTASGCAWVKLPGIAGATSSMNFVGGGTNYRVLAPISAAALKLCQDKFPSTTPDNGHDYLNVWIDGLMLIYDKVRPFYS